MRLCYSSDSFISVMACLSPPKFLKSKPSIGGMHKFELLTHTAVINKNNQLWRWPGGRVLKISSMRKYMFGDMGEKVGASNCHISRYKAFPKMRT